VAFALRAFTWRKGLGLWAAKCSRIGLILLFHLDFVGIYHNDLIDFVDIRDFDNFISAGFGYLGIDLFSFVGINSSNVGSVAISFIIELVIVDFIAIDSEVDFVETGSVAVDY